MRKARTTATTVAVAVLFAAGCDSGKSTDTGAPAPGVPISTAPSPSASPSVTPSSPTTPPVTTPPKAPQKLKRGAKGTEVIALQQRLSELGYWNGKADGKFGSTTQQAIFAVQKTAGLQRDGVVGPKTQKALDQGVRPKARSTAGTGRLIEINLTKQLLMIVDNGQITQVFNTSTGSNEYYEHEGETYLADTPSGRFRVGRQIDGWRHGPLGPLWRPKYFNGGIAVHGAPSVPAYPASHGCARVSIAAMNWLWANDKIPLKTKVWVYNT
jgi:peptidoglycan hydrolase-like protein with peptidoglycan-binding domain